MEQGEEPAARNGSIERGHEAALEHRGDNGTAEAVSGGRIAQTTALDEGDRAFLGHVLERLASYACVSSGGGQAKPCLADDEILRVCNLAEQAFLSYIPPRALLRFPDYDTWAIGDVHGKFDELRLWLVELGVLCGCNGELLTEKRLLFLGDYVDRGPNSLEVCLLCFSLLALHPQQVFLLRGNHEDDSTNCHSLGANNLWVECCSRLGSLASSVFFSINKVFSYLPMAALLAGKVLAVHGGLARNCSRLEDIAQLEVPCDSIHSQAVMADLAWSDPSPTGKAGWSRNRRGGDTVCFGPDVLDEFLDVNGLDLLLRAHEFVARGFSCHPHHGGRIITIFSAPNYCSGMPSDAAVLFLEDVMDAAERQILEEAAGNGCGARVSCHGRSPPDSASSPPAASSAAAEQPAAGPAAQRPPQLRGFPLPTQVVEEGDEQEEGLEGLPAGAVSPKAHTSSTELEHLLVDDSGEGQRGDDTLNRKRVVLPGLLSPSLRRYRLHLHTFQHSLSSARPRRKQPRRPTAPTAAAPGPRASSDGSSYESACEDDLPDDEPVDDRLLPSAATATTGKSWGTRFWTQPAPDGEGRPAPCWGSDRDDKAHLSLEDDDFDMPVRQHRP